MTAQDRHGSRNKKLSVHIFSDKLKAESVTWKYGRLFISEPLPSGMLSPVRLCHLNLPK